MRRQGRLRPRPGGLLRGFPHLPTGILSHDPFNCLFQALDPAAFAEAIAPWTEGLRQRQVAKKINEFTADARQSQRNVANAVTEADYVQALKGNQGTRTMRCAPIWTTRSSGRNRNSPR